MGFPDQQKNMASPIASVSAHWVKSRFFKLKSGVQSNIHQVMSYLRTVGSLCVLPLTICFTVETWPILMASVRPFCVQD